MEKRNVAEPDRTPCRSKQDDSKFCDCKKHVGGEKSASDKDVNYYDVDRLARLHK